MSNGCLYRPFSKQGVIHQVSADLVELMRTLDSFLLKGIGLTLTPFFPVPDNWKNFDTKVLVITPGGVQSEFQAEFQIQHFNFREPGVDINRHWRIVVVLPFGSKEDVPVGSRVLVTPHVKQALEVADS